MNLGLFLGGAAGGFRPRSAVRRDRRVRGLAGGSTLALLLREKRGRGHKRHRPPLTVAKILSWADAHHRRNGQWPSGVSMPVEDAPGETWAGLDSALCNGRRGLEGGSSLARLLAKERGVRHPMELPRLTTLNVSYTQVTDAGMKQFKDYPQLTSLAVGHTKVSDAGLKELKELKQLTYLALEGTFVTNAGMKDVKELKQLKWLRLMQTKVGDAGLKELTELKNLRMIELFGCKFSDAGMREFKKALPKCKIYK